MKKNIRIKAVEKSGIVTVKTLIKHPMETGRRKDQEGNLLRMHHISEFRVMVNGIKKWMVNGAQVFQKILTCLLSFREKKEIKFKLNL